MYRANPRRYFFLCCPGIIDAKASSLASRAAEAARAVAAETEAPTAEASQWRDKEAELGRVHPSISISICIHTYIYLCLSLALSLYISS